MYKSLLFVSLLALTACEVSTPADLMPTPPVDTFDHVVSGPSLEGAWRSDCTYKSFDNHFVVLTLTVTGKNVVRGSETFSDNRCTSQIKKQARTGAFRFSQTFPAGFYEVDYRLYLNDAKTAWENTKETVRLKNGMLMISDFYAGETEPTIALLPPLTATTAHDPEVGHKAIYVGVKAGINIEEIYVLKAFSSTYQDWQVQQEVRNLDSGVISTSRVMNMTDVASTTKFNTTMKNCEKSGNVREVLTVPAGTFETCRVKKQDAYYWYANTPILGAVKIENLAGDYRIELKSFVLTPSLFGN